MLVETVVDFKYRINYAINFMLYLKSYYFAIAIMVLPRHLLFSPLSFHCAVASCSFGLLFMLKVTDTLCICLFRLHLHVVAAFHFFCHTVTVCINFLQISCLIWCIWTILLYIQINKDTLKNEYKFKKQSEFRFYI